ncbi:phage head closure protein [Streptomyces sp. NPDC060198]|uniref:phage head closure protein n=1 Tax=Streptomyces sp. NPDC060198 TaxID=3347070 RepID=UPI003652507D
MIGRWLNRTLQVWRETTVPDGAGGQTSTWVLQASVGAKVDQASASAVTIAQQSGARLTHSVYVLPTADVQRRDELRADGRTYRVIAEVEPSGPRYRRADCELIQKQGGT